jgi:hypothetical protein
VHIGRTDTTFFNEAIKLMMGGPLAESEWNQRRQNREGIPDLSGVHLFRADLSGANLRGAILGGTRLSQVDSARANFTGAICLGTDFVNVDLSDVMGLHLVSCRIEEAEQAARIGMAISLEEGRGIERREDVWVIVDPPAYVLIEVERIAWSNDEPGLTMYDVSRSCGADDAATRAIFAAKLQRPLDVAANRRIRAPHRDASATGPEGIVRCAHKL